MLTKVKVKNFQSLADIELELGVLTVLVGQNDLGKSAFFRAVRAASEARSGSDFIREGTTQTKVELEIDGQNLLWEKGAQKNRYELNGLPYERVGRQVPPDIEQLIGMSSVEFDKNLSLNLNFADQDDPPFLVPFPGGITSSQVAKVLGDLTNLNVLYRAVAEANLRRKRADNEAENARSTSTALQMQIQSYDGLFEQQERVEQLVEWVEAVEHLMAHVQELEVLRYNREDLRKAHGQIELDKARIGEDLTPQQREVERTAADLHAFYGYRDTIAEYSEAAGEAQSELVQAAQDLSNAELAHQRLMQEIKVCPLCGHELNESHTGHPLPANA